MPDFSISPGTFYENVGADTSLSRGTVLTGGGANTKGAYTQLSASCPLDVDGFSIGTVFSAAVIAEYFIDIAVGGAGSEQVILSNFVGYRANAPNADRSFIPLKIAKGSRITARCQSTTAASTLFISLLLQAGGLVAPVGNSIAYTYGATTGSTSGVSIDPGGTANTKGAWTQITSSSAQLRGLILRIGNKLNSVRAGYTWLVDVGIGAAASEQVILPNMAFSASTTTDYVIPMGTNYLSKDIPPSTRIAVRSQCSGTDATDRLFDAIIYGFN